LLSSAFAVWGEKKREKGKENPRTKGSVVQGKKKLINAFRCCGDRIYYPIGVCICPLIF